jgi:hypothetical protein
MSKKEFEEGDAVKISDFMGYTGKATVEFYRENTDVVRCLFPGAVLGIWVPKKLVSLDEEVPTTITLG